MSEVFNLRTDKSERLAAVMDIVSQAYDKCTGKDGNGGSRSIRSLRLETRRTALDPRETSLLLKVLFQAIKHDMEGAGHRGLEVPLVEAEVLHLRFLMAEEGWDGNRIPRVAIEDGQGNVSMVPDPKKLKDDTYNQMVRNNYKIVLEKGKIAIWPYAKAFGLHTLCFRESTEELLTKVVALRKRIGNGVLTMDQDELQELASREDMVEMILSRVWRADYGSMFLTNEVPWLHSFSALMVLGAKVMKVADWEQMLTSSRDIMLKYGRLLRDNISQEAFKKIRSAVKKAAQETSSEAHAMVRALGAHLGTQEDYIVFLDDEQVDVSKLRSTCNGTRMPSCIVKATVRDQGNEAHFHVMVQGTVAYRTRSVVKAYQVFFVLQNLLFLAPATGKKSVSNLVAAMNLLCFGVRYQRSPLKKSFFSFMRRLDALAGAEIRQEVVAR